MSTHADEAATTRMDCSFLALVTVLNSFLYLPRLGFYSDDWAFWRVFRFSADQSLPGLIQSVFAAEPDTMARPLQGFLHAALYQLFGLNPLGYHVSMAAMFCLGLCALYLALRRLSDDRFLTVAVVLVYATLPHYSTDHFWYSSSQITLSMALYFASLWCDVRHAGNPVGLYWPTASILCLVCSGMAYEAFLPLFLVNPLLVALRNGWRWRRFLANPVLIGMVLAFKFATSSRAQFRDMGIKKVLASGVDFTFGAYGVDLPRVLRTIWDRYWDEAAFATAAILATIVAWYLFRYTDGLNRNKTPPPVSQLGVTVLAGFLLTGLSYAYFNDGLGLVTGIGNRVAIAAAAPLSFSIVAFLGLLSRAVGRANVARAIFAIAVALVCGCGCWINQTIASFWIDASEQQHRILSEIKQAIPAPPARSAILLDGFCPWIGPGIVFETDWDVTGALALLYQDASVHGDVLRPRMTITDGGVLNLWEDPSGYTYSFESLFFYDVGKRQALRVTDRNSAVRYQLEASRDPRNSCLANEHQFGAGAKIW